MGYCCPVIPGWGSRETKPHSSQGDGYCHGRCLGALLGSIGGNLGLVPSSYLQENEGCDTFLSTLQHSVFLG